MFLSDWLWKKNTLHIIMNKVNSQRLDKREKYDYNKKNFDLFIKFLYIISFPGQLKIKEKIRHSLSKVNHN